MLYQIVIRKIKPEIQTASPPSLINMIILRILFLPSAITEWKKLDQQCSIV